MQDNKKPMIFCKIMVTIICTFILKGVVVAAGNSDFLGLTNRWINIHLVTGHEHNSKENFQFLL